MASQEFPKKREHETRSRKRTLLEEARQEDKGPPTRRGMLSVDEINQSVSCVPVSSNGPLDPESVLQEHEREIQTFINRWTGAERQIFKEKYLQNPQNFGLIASFLPEKSVQDCVRFYYMTKKTEKYKQLEQNLQRERNETKAKTRPRKRTLPEEQDNTSPPPKRRQL